MERFNGKAQAALFSGRRLARTEPERALTEGEDFPSYHISKEVPVAPAGWVLRIGGMVKTGLHLHLADLKKLPRTDLRVRHHCVEGWSAVASWHGVRLSEIARIAGADPRAPFVEFRSFDQGYSSSWDLESAMHPQTILAYGKDGTDLEPEYGAPVRLYSAVKLGYKMVKYVTDVRFMPKATGGYWEDLGYEWFAGV